MFTVIPLFLFISGKELNKKVIVKILYVISVKRKLSILKEEIKSNNKGKKLLSGVYCKTYLIKFDAHDRLLTLFFEVSRSVKKQ